MIEEFKDQKEIQMIIIPPGKWRKRRTNNERTGNNNATKYNPYTKITRLGRSCNNLRGHIIPIIDGKKKFMLDKSEYNGNSRIIVLDVDHEIIGLIVDEYLK
jgi:purine-binding chemotaxis protein CheW